MFEVFSGGFVFLIFIVGIFLFMSLKVLNEYERGVIFRLGRVIGAKGPGLIILIPVVILFWIMLFVAAVVVPIIGALKANQGTYYRYPFVGVTPTA